VTTIFGLVVVAILIGLAAFLFLRGSRGTGSLLIVGTLVVAAVASAYLYNLVPGLQVAPNEHKRTSCNRYLSGDSYYRWDITAHEWTCWDNWLLIPGVRGV
jgi:hypothetical protein